MKAPNFAEVARKVRQATPVPAALVSAAAATATLYLYVRDRSPRLRVQANNGRFHRPDGTLVARPSDFARRHFFMYNDGNKPVKIEEVRVEFVGEIGDEFPVAAMPLDVYTERDNAPIPGWLDQHHQIASCSADVGAVERFLHRQGHSGPMRLRLVVLDALGNTYGNYFEVLARPDEGPMSKMHKVLRDNLKERVADASPGQGVRVTRGEVQAMGSEIGLTLDESITVFEDLGCVVWRGEYEYHEPGDQEEWSGVWVTFVGSV